MNAQLKPVERKELLIGCGADTEIGRRKALTWADHIPEGWSNLVRLDINPDVKPDVVHDLEVLPYPFADNEFDEIHAYEVLEHIGDQGDYETYFAQFSELWRMLKPGGYLIGSCPLWDGHWAWGDPGHRRILSRETLLFLNQQFYVDQVGKTSCTDYRSIYKADFEIVDYRERDQQFFFVLQAKK